MIFADSGKKWKNFFSSRECASERAVVGSNKKVEIRKKNFYLRARTDLPSLFFFSHLTSSKKYSVFDKERNFHLGSVIGVKLY